MVARKLAEFFMLPEAGHLLPRVEARPRVREPLARARQQHRAAALLWSSGHAAEGLRLEVAALATLAEVSLGATGETDLAGALAVLRVDDVNRAVALISRAREAALPALDAEITSEHADLYTACHALVRELEHALGYAILEARPRRAKLATRWLVTGLAAALAITVVVRLTTHAGMHVRASYEQRAIPRLDPDRLVDGDPRTEWIPPPNMAAWVELELADARAIRAVRVTNGHGGARNDQAAQEVRVIVKRANGSDAYEELRFDAFSDLPITKEARFQVPDAVTVRVEVPTWFRNGPALAEIELVSE